MPELPEAETIARILHTQLAGKTVARVALRRRELLHGDRRPLNRTLTGRRVVSVTRRAKRVVFTFDPACTFIVRLGMTGRLLVSPPAASVDRHVHLRMWFRETDEELRFRDVRRFGDLWCITRPEHADDPALGRLGPEPLELAPPTFAALLKRQRPIKSLLLDQSIIAGLGNIYCDEALHAAGIHPRTPARLLDAPAAARLLRAIKSVLRRSIRYGGTTFLDYRTPTGDTGAFYARLRVYQRRDQPCHKCGTPIERIRLVGRSTFFCPRCQTRKTKAE
ncbi:MAG TPA: bifunctional DNA-formamidopyrimidine glycosylase/DNA-(apurinic or apyrimidinic site) lyase [Phycisphaerae bacterium]|nr:bifunctional DNA-formamidopyrimidine glycosylase/DNA-(apurinic or apyrimidinic site) lyase [Phycisphaerae bacterium]HNU45671.1 bifunctional DNA-formamidopyrimidine glycosylase/DNA-(apurinic or apyrimidinic site) lyase [Phycisphaerae bacterium]